ncbi:MAG TPA: hypothetical protein VGP72_14760 [Planctomycetota bacterium]|jgi:hypothetical protein
MADNQGTSPAPLHSEDYTPAGDFEKLAEAVKAGRIPQETVDAAAAGIKAATEKAKSNSELVQIATQALGVLKPFLGFL